MEDKNPNFSLVLTKECVNWYMISVELGYHNRAHVTSCFLILTSKLNHPSTKLYCPSAGTLIVGIIATKWML